MKANELRIGNWVEVPKDARYEERFIKWENENFYHIHQGYLEFEDIFPIPLTEEWLVKFGFTKSRYNKNIFEIGQVYELRPHTEEIGFFEFGWVNDESGYIASVQYVHQLQNLYFSLTGEELEIQETTK